jgi:hypothetical protein
MTAWNNIAIGINSLQNNTTGYSNIAIGQALLNNITGVDNIAIGTNALENNRRANNNTAVGTFALKNSSGSNNTAFGWYADVHTYNENSNFNTAIGSEAYITNLDNSSNPVVRSTAIGAYSKTNGFSRSTAIGYEASSTAANQITLGTSAETVFIPGILNTSNASFTNASITSLRVTNINGAPYGGTTSIGGTTVQNISNVSNVSISNSNISVINISGNSIISQSVSNTMNGIFISSGSTMAYPTDATFDSINVTGIATASSFSSTSDLRMKEIIRPISIEEAKHFLNNNSTVIFKWKKETQHPINSGYIAQEIIDSGFEHLVTTIDNKDLSDGKQYVLNYAGIIPYHATVIKHLMNEIEILKEQIKKYIN